MEKYHYEDGLSSARLQTRFLKIQDASLWSEFFETPETLTFIQNFEPVCVNGNAGVGATASPSNTSYFLWSVSPSAGFSSSNSSNAQGLITFSTCGIYSITCSAYNSSSVIIASTTSTISVACSGITLTPVTQTICPGSNASITAAGALSYSWNTGAITSSMVSSPSTNTVYTVTGNTGCSASASVSIFNMTLAASAGSLCPSSQLSLTSVGGTSYSWLQPPNNQFASTSNSQVVVSPSVLPITYTVVGLYGTSCISVKTISVGLFPFSVPALPSTSVCAGVASTLSLPPVASYTWGGPTQTLTGGTFSFSQNTTTTYTVFADSSGCLASKFFSVGLHPNPVLNLTASSSIICPNQIVNLFVSGAINYTWVSHPSLLSSLFGSSVAAAPLVSTVYSVSGTNSFGCRGFTDYSVTVGIIPSLVATANSGSLCPGFVTTLSAVGANSYTWISNTFTGTVISPTLAGSAGNYTVLASNGGTCRDSTTINITLNPPLNLTVSQSASATCIQYNGYIEPIIFNASGAAHYTWSPFSPGLMTYSLGPGTSVTPTISTCYTVTGSTALCTGSAVVCVSSGYCSGVFDSPVSAPLTVFPNPVNEKLFFSCNCNKQFHVRILNQQGQTIISRDFNFEPSALQEIPTGFLEPGVYYILSQHKGGSVQAIKLIKE